MILPTFLLGDSIIWGKTHRETEGSRRTFEGYNRDLREADSESNWYKCKQFDFISFLFRQSMNCRRRLLNNLGRGSVMLPFCMPWNKRCDNKYRVGEGRREREEREGWRVGEILLTILVMSMESPLQVVQLANNICITILCSRCHIWCICSG